MTLLLLLRPIYEEAGSYQQEVAPASVKKKKKRFILKKPVLQLLKKDYSTEDAIRNAIRLQELEAEKLAQAVALAAYRRQQEETRLLKEAEERYQAAVAAEIERMRVEEERWIQQIEEAVIALMMED